MIYEFEHDGHAYAVDILAAYAATEVSAHGYGRDVDLASVDPERAELYELARLEMDTYITALGRDHDVVGELSRGRLLGAARAALRSRTGGGR